MTQAISLRCLRWRRTGSRWRLFLCCNCLTLAVVFKWLERSSPERVATALSCSPRAVTKTFSTWSPGTVRAVLDGRDCVRQPKCALFSVPDFLLFYVVWALLLVSYFNGSLYCISLADCDSVATLKWHGNGMLGDSLHSTCYFIISPG